MISTNVPFLHKSIQNETLRQFAERHFAVSREDLATVMLDRLRRSALTVAAVSPMAWLSLGRYEEFRKKVLLTSACSSSCDWEHGRLPESLARR